MDFHSFNAVPIYCSPPWSAYNGALISKEVYCCLLCTKQEVPLALSFNLVVAEGIKAMIDLASPIADGRS